MSSQLFDPVQVEYGGKRVRGLKATCGKCSAVIKTHVNSMSNGGGHSADRLDEQFCTRRFVAHGWFIGTTPGKHRCPVCVKTNNSAKPFAKLEKLKEQIAMPPPAEAAEAPREMSRDDRRLIFAKLNEVYADPKTGYSAHWTDKLVATDLGVPRAWITEIREDMFGPEGGNLQITNAMADARRLLAEVAVLQQQVGPLVAEAKRIETLSGEINKRLAGIEKAVRP
jgi:hypothetical protein